MKPPSIKIQAIHRPNVIYHYIQDKQLKPDFVVDVTGFVDVKMEAIKAYSSQFFNPNSKEPVTPISTEAFLNVSNQICEYLEDRLVLILQKDLR